MNKPNYQNSIVNLMSSILSAFSCKNNYASLDNFKIDSQKYQNIVCIVIDALGYEFLKKHKSSFLHQNMQLKLSSVFPTTTSSAITSFLTAQAPLQHGMTGWYMYFKELATAAVSLPFSPRFTGKPFDGLGISGADVFNHENAFDKNNISYSVMFPSATIDSAYSSHSFNSPNKVAYEDHQDFFATLSKKIRINEKKENMIFAYYPFFDATAHVFGINSNESNELFFKIDHDLQELIEKFDNGNTLFIITADHGMVDIKEDNKLQVQNFPIIEKSLILPLCGESRVPFAYVRPSYVKEFESFIYNDFTEYGTMMRLHEAIDAELFGFGDINPKLVDRVGDYIIFMKEEYVLLDPLFNEKASQFIGFHGGLSDDELYVPLIRIGK
ncbi:MAG: alkaline phosphatase family protein [Candidatus Cloacimonadales bacterium]|jgi:predicted AlkP superfamily pyrophosphatase or phosphodiesterase|nr:alkaline phosphatase family protein [Candidatus Cloacimonadota bacterium]MDD2649572.1 alkaline phosphatase family protein [Candidatus Cloacimonadota bacterium]MDX9977603.1 alkaline phosphatase family protein [Candidatus Cloacimonadales bacterium]